MSKNLAKVLGRPENEVTKAVAKLEQKTGFTSEDVRLLAENKFNLRAKIGQLGLDPDDTTDAELYHALLNKFEKDSQNLNRALGVDQNTDLGERLDKAIQLADYCADVDEMWVVKNSAAKAILKKYPPKHVAKALHFRSVASMIKREDVAEIYLAGSVLESSSWQKAIAREISKLGTPDYEMRALRVIKLAPKRWATVKVPVHHMASDKSIGAVAIWPSDHLKYASVAYLTLQILGEMRALNPEGYSESIQELSPSLRWWADSYYLISDGEQPVSFNLKDVALNHLNRTELESAHTKHGAEELWHELSSRYQRVSDSLAASIPDIEYNFSRSKMPTGSDLAAEYITIE